MKHIVYHDPETNRAVIVTPAYNDKTRDRSLTDADLIKRAISKSIPPSVGYSVMDTKELPANRDNRNNWKYDHQRKAIITS